MILSGKEIERHMGNEIIIKPFNKSQLNPNSYNLRLADELMIYDLHELDMKKKKNKVPMMIIDDSQYKDEPINRDPDTWSIRKQNALFLCWKDVLL